jgi:hypothetical protein
VTPEHGLRRTIAPSSGSRGGACGVTVNDMRPGRSGGGRKLRLVGRTLRPSGDGQGEDGRGGGS